MTRGYIFSVEEFAIHDGPGIRTNVFLKGCPLKCAWCHNPEGISPFPQYMVKRGQRTLCGYEVSSDELASLLLKNKDIYRLNKGGVTLTGGEPLFQADFVIDLMRTISPEIHTVMETSGYAGRSVFQEVAGLFDLVLFDVKHTDPVLHKKYTGVDNVLIMDNLNYLCASDTDFVVRIPLIPGVNDTERNMLNVVSIIKGSPTLKRVELLPYHKTAGAKYAMIGKDYNPPFRTDIEPEIYNVFDENNIEMVIL